MIGNTLTAEYYVTGASGVPTKGVLTGTTTLAGTFNAATTSNVITGIGTAFKGNTGVQIGDYLYSSTNNQVRRIKSIIDDTYIGIDRPFTNTVTGDTVKVARRGFPRTIVLKDTGSTNASIVYGRTGSLSFANGKTESINNAPSGIEPMTYDASAASAQLTIEVYY